MSQFDPPPAVPSVPEPSGDFGVPAEPPAWPKGIGVFSIVWASLGLTCGGCGLASLAAQAPMYEWGRQQQAKAGRDPGPMPQVFLAGPPEFAGMAVSVVGVAVLLAAGIALVRRRPAGRTLHLVYAGISILGTLMGLAFAVSRSGAVQAYITAHPDDPFVRNNPMARVGSSIGVALATSLIALIYPTFIAIWFLLVKRRPEDMGGFTDEPAV
jgi:hypothetical protein